MTSSAFITIVGRTNAGKSSLLNSLVGEKLAIVSDKPQTTRTRIIGILNRDGAQLVFTDTPGLHKATTKLSEHMLNEVSESITSNDLVLFVADCTRRPAEQEREMLKNLAAGKAPVVLVLNKIDLLDDKARLAQRIAEFSALMNFSSVIPISVKENDGVDLVLAEALCHAEESPHFFPSDMLTDRSEKYLAAEMVREKLLLTLRDEVPHGVAVEVETFEERQDKDILNISVVIYCERQSHKGIIIGKGGETLKNIATLARAELEAFFRIQVNLKCFVKVRENWRNKEGVLKSMGF